MKYILTCAFILAGVGLCNGGQYMDMTEEEIDSTEFGVFKGKKSTTCPCGMANKDSKRIIGGKETGVNEYPFMAGVMYRRSKLVVCGGSIITRYHVLTAAHCTQPMKQSNNLISVVVGEHDLIRRSETPATVIIDVVESIEHENYILLGHQNDISLLVLEKAIEFNKLVSPVCLPTKVEDLRGKYIRVIGWGRTAAQGSGSDVLLKAHLRVIPTDECNKKLPLKLPLEIPRVFCAFSKTKDSCKGDSGGPLLWVDLETNRYTQVGIVSFGISCGTDKPGVNTNVAFYLNWIHEKIRATKPECTICQKA